MKLFESEWQQYATVMVSPVSSDAHFREVRRAFYAGAIIFMNTIAEMAEDEEEKFQDLRTELREFSARVDAGKA